MGEARPDSYQLIWRMDYAVPWPAAPRPMRETPSHHQASNAQQFEALRWLVPIAPVLGGLNQDLSDSVDLWDRSLNKFQALALLLANHPFLRAPQPRRYALPNCQDSRAALNESARWLPSNLSFAGRLPLNCIPPA